MPPRRRMGQASDPPAEKLRKLLATDFVTTQLGEMPEPLRAAFRTAFGLETGEVASTEIIMAVSMDEAQSLLKDAQVNTANAHGATEARALKGVELGRMMAPLRRVAREIDQLEAAVRTPPQVTAVPTAAPTALEDHTANKFTDVVAR